MLNTCRRPNCGLRRISLFQGLLIYESCASIGAVNSHKGEDMSAWILIVIVATLNGPTGVTAIEFNTKEACENAKIEVEKAPGTRTSAICVSKGDK